MFGVIQRTFDLTVVVLLVVTKGIPFSIIDVIII